MDIYNEFNDNYAKKLRMDAFKSRKVTKKYAFDVEIPTESDYLELRYSVRLEANLFTFIVLILFFIGEISTIS